MDGGAADPGAGLEDGLVHLKTVIAFSAEAGEQRRVDVDYPALIFRKHFGPEFEHEAGETDQIGAGAAAQGG